MKAIDREGSGFAFLQEKFPWVSKEKLKTGKFDGPRISELMKDPMFDRALNDAEQSIGVRNTRRKMKSYRRVSANLGHECQSNCTFCDHTWTIFQRTVKIWVKSKVTAFTKTFALCKNTTKFGGMYAFSLTIADVWNVIRWLPNTGGSSGKDLSSINSSFCVFFSLLGHNVSFLWVFQP